MITINGDIYITNYGQTLDELVETETEVDTEDELDCDNNYSEECEDEEDYKASIEEIIDELTSFYAEILSNDDCLCPECIKKILIDYTMDFLSDTAEIK